MTGVGLGQMRATTRATLTKFVVVRRLAIAVEQIAVMGSTAISKPRYFY
jgi:hypothetical protein